MRLGALVAVLLATACATAKTKPVAADAGLGAVPGATRPPQASAPAAPRADGTGSAAAAEVAMFTLEFVSVSATRDGGSLDDTRYSEKPDDARILEKSFEEGVVSYTGQLGLGKGSAWAGFGFGVSFTRDASPVDLSSARTITFHLASPTTQVLRIRITGADRAILNAGCYPVVIQPVTPELTEYVIPIARFAPEAYCGPSARTIEQTALQATGVEIVDIAYQRAPSTFMVGTIVVK